MTSETTKNTLKQIWVKKYLYYPTEAVEIIKDWLQQNPFPNYNAAKYALPDGWTVRDQKDQMEVYIGDVLKWKKKIMEDLNK